MPATVLKSELAVQQSIVIMRTFKNMRHYITENLSHKKKGVYVILFTENGSGIQKVMSPLYMATVLYEYWLFSK